MKEKNLKIAAAAVLLPIVLSAFNVKPAFAGNIYKSMAKEFGEISKNKGFKKVAVVGFLNKNDVSREETEYISDKLTTQLVRTEKLQVVERQLLSKIAEEKKLALSGLTADEKRNKIGEILSVDAIISGSVFSEGENLKIMAKLINIENGQILKAFEGEIERVWTLVPEPPETDFNLDAVYAAVPADLRDSPKDSEIFVCEKAYRDLEGLQKKSVELKARYWAAKMKSPGFSYSELTRNPGSEIKNPGVKRRFYELLQNSYYSGIVSLNSREQQLVQAVFDKEKKVSDECGLY
ncbi:MAG: hypothetical protein HY746_03555 [Elusimicrobia bacterium]|nr:hypothetical protein [Elusimicrobiota bacterium]